MDQLALLKHGLFLCHGERIEAERDASSLFHFVASGSAGQPDERPLAFWRLVIDGWPGQCRECDHPPEAIGRDVAATVPQAAPTCWRS
jgi:hypothetical protein